MKIYALIALLALTACGGAGSDITIPTALPALAAEAGSVQASGLDNFMRGKVRWSTTDRSVTARIESPPYDLPGPFLLQVNDRTNSPQRMVGWTVSIPIEKGVPVSWTVDGLGCGVPYEAELYASRTPVPNDRISGGYLLASHQFTIACEGGSHATDACIDVPGMQRTVDGWFSYAQGCYRHFCAAGTTGVASINHAGVWFTTGGALDLATVDHWGVCK